MQPEPIAYSAGSLALVKTAIRENWKQYHYFLGRAPTVELSIGRYLTWLITNMPDHFLNLVICTSLPELGTNELINDALEHFRDMNVRKLSWIAEEGVAAEQLKECLTARGLRFSDSFAVEMAIDLNSLSDQLDVPNGLKICHVESDEMLRQWIHVASVGFGVPPEAEEVWFEFFNYAACRTPFQTFLAFQDEEPVATSQLCLAAGVAGIYNVTTLPAARRHGIGSALVLAALHAARHQGYHVGILQASKMGYPVYQKLGFQDFGKLGVYTWEA